MRHVALMIPGLERIAGAEQQLLMLALGLRQRGLRVSVIVLTGLSATRGADLAEQGIHCYSLGMRKGIADPRGWLRLDRWIRREKPDLLHAHLPHATWMARWMRVLHPRLVVLDTLHSCATGGRLRHFGYRVSAWLSSGTTAVSVPVAEAHGGAGLVDPRRLRVVPNGIDCAAFAPDAARRQQARAAYGLADEFVWIAAGRLAKVKDYPTMLQAFACLPQSARLLIAGEGPLDSELRAQIDQLGLSGSVRLLGFVEDMRMLYAAADALVMASLWEGMPMALLEAGASALPTVATRVPGVSHMLDDGENGLLAESGTPAGLAQAMHRLMQMSANERAQMGQQARSRVERFYGREAVLNEWEELYESLASSESGYGSREKQKGDSR